LDPSEAETSVAQITQTPPSALGTLELRWKAYIALNVGVNAAEA
jgi:hypothetical protein